jgi:hypothetical protein
MGVSTQTHDKLLWHRILPPQEIDVKSCAASTKYVTTELQEFILKKELTLESKGKLLSQTIDRIEDERSGLLQIYHR